MKTLTTRGLGLLPRLGLLKWELDHAIRLAKKQGQHETAACLETAQAAVLDGKDEIK